MRKIALFLILTVLLASCATQRRCSLKFPVQSSRDSIYVEKLKEVPVYLKGDTVKIDVPVNCPDQDIVSIENGKLKQQIKILNGKLVSKTEIKPDTVIINTVETVTNTVEVKVPEPVKVVPKFYKYCTFGFIGIILIAGIYFFLKWKVKILSLFR